MRLTLLLLLVAVCAAAEDYYEVLGVSRHVGEEELKSAYKKLARKWHPDLHEDKEVATEMMKLINEAKDTLSDPEKRQRYDRMAQRMSSVADSLSAFGSLPPIVLIYMTCPVYLSFSLNPILASFLCTSMLLSHLAGIVACYLFYKYALWGPVPIERRKLFLHLSIPVRFLMIFFILAFALLFVISATEYIPWVLGWVVTPCFCMWVVDITMCVATSKERKNCGPAGSPKVITRTFHKRPAWMPIWMSLHDSSGLLSDWLHSLDHDPVVQYEYTRTTEVEKRYRRCDIERINESSMKVEARKQLQKEKEASERIEKERQRKMQADLIAKNAKRSSIKAVEQKVKPEREEAPPVKAAPAPPAEPKKGEVPNVVSTGSAAWNPSQQRDFERALRKYPPGTSKRWEAISEIVPEKTAKQCADRFKELASLRSALKTSK